jgi:purine-binding chemotaxis protein CheW
MEATSRAPEGRPRVRTDRDLRSERAAALARRGMAAGESDTGVDHLVCACGADRYGLPLTAVAQILPMRPCTPMPGAMPALIGLVALSGRIVGVLSLARALGRPDAPPAPEAEGGHLVVLRSALSHAQPHHQGHVQPIAFAVDRVLGIVRAAGTSDASPGIADPDGLGNEAASGYAPGATSDGRPDFVVIDLPRLLRRVLP